MTLPQKGEVWRFHGSSIMWRLFGLDDDSYFFECASRSIRCRRDSFTLWAEDGRAVRVDDKKRGS